ncbi:uncharacterized protein K452DRAFT_6931 [Aplosporella prunicola CBS 121167]|uniref:Uncharacterized protein n=1 Tax=Aplosporella prunicola CBS 121167 TaxID=1176127 RepID=A0A6A6BTG1_9PEZI|nr:uncharacterized protein K452DRAFT_6931 [Aplosporella prunicola CBS 121167]KAF2147402.1 hypothetical protein K452DRAFT_6931 [Aplosporella prunicola CBS 121167]
MLILGGSPACEKWEQKNEKGHDRQTEPRVTRGVRRGRRRRRLSHAYLCTCGLFTCMGRRGGQVRRACRLAARVHIHPSIPGLICGETTAGRSLGHTPSLHQTSAQTSPPSLPH